MKFTKHELDVIIELEKRAGDVLYMEDLSPYFISKSCLQISTYTQTAYIQVGDKMQDALSEYFQLVVFIKKLEENGACFSIPYTPLEDNLVQIGNSEFEEYQQHTIADGDLLLQLFKYAGKKYVMAPKTTSQNQGAPVSAKRQPSKNFIIPGLILFLLFSFIAVIGYLSYEDHNQLKMKQEDISADLKKQEKNIHLLTSQFENAAERQEANQINIRKALEDINKSLNQQEKSLRYINYWSRKQYKQLEILISFSPKDSLE